MHPAYSVSIGNDLINAELMKVMGLRFVSVQAEGVHMRTLLECDAI